MRREKTHKWFHMVLLVLLKDPKALSAKKNSPVYNKKKNTFNKKERKKEKEQKLIESSVPAD